MHVLFHCELYDELRKNLFTKITKQNRLFESFNSIDKLSFLFNNTDPRISKLAAGFIFKATEKRKKQ